MVSHHLIRVLNPIRLKGAVLLHLNRAFFSRAITLNPDSPHDSPYASSFLAIFRCAVTLLEAVNTIYEKLPAAVIPIGLIWTDVLMSAVSFQVLRTVLESWTLMLQFFVIGGNGYYLLEGSSRTFRTAGF